VALVGIQLDMIRTLSSEYGVTFRRDIGKSVITTLLGGFIPVALGGTLSSLIKCIPLIGQTTGAITMPVISGASTYAIYKVFIQHFESGGTFLDLDPAKVKSYFAEQFTKGKKVAADLKKDETATPAN
ncbi:MAG: GTPase, partial [Chlorobiaceae bacterium]